MEIFDNEAKSYDTWYTTPLGRFVDELETLAVMETLQPKSSEIILDVGCGTGNYAIKLAQRGCIVVGIDISEEMLAIARKKCQELNLRIELLNANAESIPFADNYFDSVVSIATFEFIRNPQKALEEMFRVVKINGKIVVGFINRESPWGELYLSEEFRTKTIFKYAYLFSKSEIILMHSEELVTIRETLYTPPNVDISQISIENEYEFSKKYLPGFLVALWKKR